MDLVRTLNSIGKSAFVKYYYNFKNESQDACIAAFAENYTDKAKSTCTGHAQRIFCEGRHQQVNTVYHEIHSLPIIGSGFNIGIVEVNKIYI